MPFSDTNVFARDDTFFGVCQALGEDLGFNPQYLRMAFAPPLLVAPLGTIAAYCGLALVVLIIRLAVPNPRRSAIALPETMPKPAAPEAVVETNEEAVAIAA